MDARTPERRIYSRMRKAKFRAAGICPNCEKRPAKTGHVCCKECLADKRILFNLRKWGSKEKSSVYNEFLKKQRNKCAICKEKTNLIIDHCHEKMKMRGLLCRKCNLALGMFKDSKLILSNAIKYLSTTDK